MFLENIFPLLGTLQPVVSAVTVCHHGPVLLKCGVIAHKGRSA